MVASTEKEKKRIKRKEPRKDEKPAGRSGFSIVE
jgi:hypothetical protein